MKAVVYDELGSPDVLRYEDMADPVPGPGELLVKIEAISIEGGDLLSRRVIPPEDPVIPRGYAASGEVIGLGSDVEGFKIGQKVATFAFKGSHAELRTAPAATCWIVPEGLDMATAATIPCGPGTAALALELGRLQRGQTVLVLGAAGGVGSAAVQLAAAAGARVMGTGTSTETLEQLKPYGLTDAIVVGDKPVPEQVHKLLDGEGVDLLIDNLGGPAFEEALPALKDGGCMVLIGGLSGTNTQLDVSYLRMHRLTAIGCLLGTVMHEPHVRQIIADLLDKAASGELKVPIDSTFPLAEAAAAHTRAEERGKLGRIIMVP